MNSLIRQWSLPAAFAAAALALTACAGSSGSPVPLAPYQILSGATQLHATSELEGVPAAACPKQYLGCSTVSLKKGLVLYWCNGPKKSACKDTKKSTWSGNVCLAKSKTCKPIEQMTAAWTGPFPCKPKPKRCYGGTKIGDYETDTISIGKTPPKQTKKYIYKQDIDLDSKLAATIGLNVGP